MLLSVKIPMGKYTLLQFYYGTALPYGSIPIFPQCYSVAIWKHLYFLNLQ